MIEELRQLMLPNDELIRRIRNKYQLDLSTIPYSVYKPLRRQITLEMVRNPQIVSAAKEYITELLKDKQEYGYLYHLANQKLLIKFDVKFNPELAIECRRYEDVLNIIEKLAKEWFCKDTLMYEITRLELLYFFILLINENMNWIMVDYFLQGSNTKGHAHLIAAPSRLLRNKKVI
ncbi:hypothetical protein AVEN_257688-1 [Araneus ventricosus]|uniref:Uncharacterized protein n=1 Tax=Araneus ventricosus TaxID=182803 RepID=A0A4Y2LIE7_ARAVE|nr:hypothetical protein AVEN_257688-1 [Araneus ventricosus]